MDNLDCFSIFGLKNKLFVIVGSYIFLWVPKIFNQGAHMAPRKFHEVASLCLACRLEDIIIYIHL